MNVHQIIYKKQMLLAKKNGWKTVTRRPIKPQPEGIEKGLQGNFSIPYINGPKRLANEVIKCPYGQPGDQLYTKENYRILAFSNFEQAVRVQYQADGHTRWMQLPDPDWEKFMDWKEPHDKKPSIFLFKSLSRFWDEVTEIKVERIQDITRAEVLNEGVYREWDGSKYWFGSSESSKSLTPDHKVVFKLIWQSMYEGGPFDWNNNPYVWVILNKPLIVNHTPTTQTEMAL